MSGAQRYHSKRKMILHDSPLNFAAPFDKIISRFSPETFRGTFSVPISRFCPFLTSLVWRNRR